MGGDARPVTLPALTKEQLEAEAAAAYIHTGSYREAAALLGDSPATVWERAQRYKQRIIATLPDHLQQQFRTQCSDFASGDADSRQDGVSL